MVLYLLLVFLSLYFVNVVHKLYQDRAVHLLFPDQSQSQVELEHGYIERQEVILVFLISYF